MAPEKVAAPEARVIHSGKLISKKSKPV
jgi:hypothetical protein